MKLRLAIKVLQRAGPNYDTRRYRWTTFRRAVKRWDRMYARVISAARRESEEKEVTS